MRLIHTQRKRFIISHILVAIVSAMMVAGGLSACTSDSDSPAPSETMVTLSLNISTTDVSRRSRADVTTPPDNSEGAATDYEKLNHLRIIIVDGTGNVEHNRFYDYRNYYYDNVTHELQVSPDDTKTIYLIANEKALRGDISLGGDGATNAQTIVDYDFNQVAVGEQLPAGFSDYQLNLPVTSEMVNNIPMSAVYTMKIGNESKQSLSFLLNRCAVKYSFNFSNQSSAPVRITELKIDKTATTEWFFPRVKKADGDVVIMHQLEYNSTDDNAIPVETATGTEATWLKDSNGKDAFYTAYLYNNYTVPDIVAHEQYTRSANLTIASKGKVTAGFTSDWKPFYLLESAYIPVDKTEQTYTVTFTVNGVELSKELPNLPLLPRNTHVVVNVTFRDNNILNCEVEMEPYRAVTLNPGFGIDDKDPDDPNGEHVDDEDLPENNQDWIKPQS